MDDYFDEGRNLENAVRMLSRQGVDANKIWLLAYAGKSKVLDYAQSFLKAQNAV